MVLTTGKEVWETNIVSFIPVFFYHSSYSLGEIKVLCCLRFIPRNFPLLAVNKDELLPMFNFFCWLSARSGIHILVKRTFVRIYCLVVDFLSSFWNSATIFPVLLLGMHKVRNHAIRNKGCKCANLCNFREGKAFWILKTRNENARRFLHSCSLQYWPVQGKQGARIQGRGLKNVLRRFKNFPILWSTSLVTTSMLALTYL